MKVNKHEIDEGKAANPTVQLPVTKFASVRTSERFLALTVQHTHAVHARALLARNVRRGLV